MKVVDSRHEFKLLTFDDAINTTDQSCLKGSKTEPSNDDLTLVT